MSEISFKHILPMGYLVGRLFFAYNEKSGAVVGRIHTCRELIASPRVPYVANTMGYGRGVTMVTRGKDEAPSEITGEMVDWLSLFLKTIGLKNFEVIPFRQYQTYYGTKRVEGIYIKSDELPLNVESFPFRHLVATGLRLCVLGKLSEKKGEELIYELADVGPPYKLPPGTLEKALTAALRKKDFFVRSHYEGFSKVSDLRVNAYHNGDIENACSGIASWISILKESLYYDAEERRKRMTTWVEVEKLFDGGGK